MLERYHLYLNHQGGSGLAIIIWEECQWKVLVTQANLFAKTYMIRQQFKKRNTIYEHLPPKIIVELKPWDLVHTNLTGPYSKSIRQNHSGRSIIKNNVSLAYITMIDPATANLVKAFYTSNHVLCIKVIQRYWYPLNLPSAIERMYENIIVWLKIGKDDTTIPFEVGVKQGNSMAPVLFLFLIMGFAETLEK